MLQEEVTAENVADYVTRQTDNQVQYDYYQDYMGENFADLQAAAREKSQPWDVSKGFDHAAPITAIHRVGDVGHLERGAIWIEVNGTMRQHGDLSEMIWSVPEIIAELSTYFELRPGDLVFTGTPAGVGRVVRGDSLVGGIDELDTLRTTIV